MSWGVWNFIACVEEGAIVAAAHVGVPLVETTRRNDLCSKSCAALRAAHVVLRAALLCCAKSSIACIVLCSVAPTVRRRAGSAMLRRCAELSAVLCFPVVLRCASLTGTDKSIKPLQAA